MLHPVGYPVNKESAAAASRNKEDPTGIYKPSAEKPGYVRRGSKWHGMAWMACGPGAVDAVQEHPGVSTEDDAQDISVGSDHGL